MSDGIDIQLVRAPLPWHKNPLELAALWRWLDEQARTPEDPAYFMEKAAKWSGEYEQYQKEEAMARFEDEMDAQRDQPAAPGTWNG